MRRPVSLRRPALPRLLGQAHRQRIAVPHERHAKKQRLIHELVQPGVVRVPRVAKPKLLVPFRVLVDEPVEPELLHETPQFAERGSAFVQVDEVRFDSPLREESQGLAGFRAFFHAEDLDFCYHRSSLRRFAPALGIPLFKIIVPHSGASHLRSEFRSSRSSFLTPALRTCARNSALKDHRSSLRRYAPALGIPPGTPLYVLIVSVNRKSEYIYRPAWWVRGGHAQTLWGKFFRQKETVPTRRERWDTPDGDFIDVHRLDASPGSPRLFLLHGLEGTIRSHYVAGFFSQAQQRGWAADLLIFR